MFTTNVPTGKDVGKYLFVSTEAKYRRTEPVPPPIKTMRMFFVIKKSVCPADFLSAPMSYNGFKLPVVRLKALDYRKAINKDRMFVGICNAKIIVFRQAILRYNHQNL